MAKYLYYTLYVWIAISIGLLLLSYFKVRNSGEQATFILPWALPLGAIIWEDLLVFSFYNIIASIVILLLQDLRYILVFPLFFWLVRSVGETIYWFLQQFNQPSQYPHNEHEWNRAGWLKTLFGDLSDQKFFILYQITMQVVTVFCLVGLTYLFKNWEWIGERVNE